MASVNLGPAFRDLSNTLYRFGADQGAHERDMAALGLKGAQLGYEMERDKPAYEAALIQTKRLKEEEADLDSDFQVVPFVQKQLGIQDFENMTEKEFSQLSFTSKFMPVAAEAIGTKYDPEKGLLIKSDGTPLTKRQWRRPENQSIVAGVLGTFADQDKILELDSKDPKSPNHQKAVELLKMKAEKPLEFNMQELNTRLRYMNQALVTGVPETTFHALKGQIDRVYKKIDALDLTPEQREKWKLDKEAKEVEIKLHKAQIGEIGKEEQETYVRLGDKGEIIGIQHFGKKTKPPEGENFVPLSEYNKATRNEPATLDEAVKLQAAKSAKIAIEKELRQFDSKLTYAVKDAYTDNYIKKHNIPIEQTKGKNRDIIEQKAIAEAKADLQQDLNTADAVINSFQRTNPFLGLGKFPKAGQTTVQPTGQSPTDALTGGMPEGDPGKMWRQGQGGAVAQPQQRKIVKTGTDQTTGKKVVMYDDGTIEELNQSIRMPIVR